MYIIMYLAERLNYSGLIDDSILLCAGVHCRLELISEEGTWTESHSFSWAGTKVERVKGQKVGNTMQSWRKLRKDHPDMLSRIKIWQSPTSYVDSIIFSWQQDEETSRMEPLVRLVDSLATHWSEQALERNWLTQAVQASIPAGLTPVCQPTDTAFAQPAKAAARRCHERQKRLFLLKASSEGVNPSFKYGCREIVEVINTMHDKMVELNEQRNTVLSEARACGWLHFRPVAGQLQPSESQAWAKNLTEGTHKTTAETRARRDEGVTDGKPREEFSKAEIEPRVMEKNYFDEEDLVLDADPDVLDQVAQRRLEAAMLHPRVRKEAEEELASLALVTSQVPAKLKVKEGTPKKTKLSRHERVVNWKTNLGKKTIASRLAQMMPCSKEARKKIKKHLIKLKLGKSKKTKAKKLVPLTDEPKAVTKEDDAAEAARKEYAAKWKGVPVRVLDRKATSLWLNSFAVVQHGEYSSKLLTVKLEGATSVQMKVLDSKVAVRAGSEKIALAVEVDARTITKSEKERSAKQMIGVAKYMLHGQQLDDPELAAFHCVLQHSSKKAKDEESIRNTAVWLNAAAGAVIFNESADGATTITGQESLVEWNDVLNDSKGGSGHLIICPIAAGGHWTLLSLMRKGAEGEYKVKYFDSLNRGSAVCRKVAEVLGRHLWRMLHLNKDEEDLFVLPETNLEVKQVDGWSCGYHCLNRAEELYREHRGEGEVIVARDISSTRKLVNKWVDVLVKYSKAEELKTAAAALQPPPLPPPVEDLKQDEHKPTATSSVPLATQPSGTWGCSKCRFSAGGCLRCNPEKQLRHTRTLNID